MALWQAPWNPISERIGSSTTLESGLEQEFSLLTARKRPQYRVFSQLSPIAFYIEPGVSRCHAYFATAEKTMGSWAKITSTVLPRGMRWTFIHQIPSIVLFPRTRVQQWERPWPLQMAASKTTQISTGFTTTTIHSQRIYRSWQKLNIPSLFYAALFLAYWVFIWTRS